MLQIWYTDRSTQVPSHPWQNTPKGALFRAQILNFKPSSIWMSEARNVAFGTWINLGKSYLTHDKNTRKRAWSGSGAEFLNFGTAWQRLHIGYLDQIKLDTSNFTNSCNVASTSQRMSSYSRRERAGSGSSHPLKTAAIESAQNRRATIRLAFYTLIANI